jgi:hypothetical protein
MCASSPPGGLEKETSLLTMEVHELIVISDSDSDESPIKPTPKKADKDGVIRPNGTLKLKRPAPKMGKPGNWREGSLVEGEP